MNRLMRFDAYATHPWLQKAYRKLKRAELDLAHKFIAENDALSQGDFEHKVNRMFLFQPDKPKNWTIILELLTCCNSADRATG